MTVGNLWSTNSCVRLFKGYIVMIECSELIDTFTTIIIVIIENSDSYTCSYYRLLERKRERDSGPLGN